MADGQGGIGAQFDPAQFAAFMRQVKEFDPKLARSLRRRLRLAGQDIVRDMQATVQSGPGSGEVGIRTGIASGIKTAVATGKRAQGVRISASSSKLPAGRRQMLRLYNKPGWRHPVFQRPGRKFTGWVAQSGSPFFGRTIRRHEDAMRTAILEALNDATKELNQ